MRSGDPAPESVQQRRSLILDSWAKFTSNRFALAGSIILAFFVVVALLAQTIAPFNPFSIVGEPLQAPTPKFLMGTDNIGRDIFSQFVLGSQISLSVGLAAAFFSTLIGIVVGSVAGFFGSYADDALMRTTDFFLILPRFFLAMFLATIFGNNVTRIIIIISVLSWPGTARLVRSRFLSLKEKEFVLSAKAIGASRFTLIFREILPNAISPAIVNGSLEVGNAILLESGLSFLGFGDANHPSWGFMLSNAQQFLSLAWWMALFPGIGILITVIAANLVGEGINESLEPKSREWRRGAIGGKTTTRN
jgi:peptide/nickel transport system permease protein